MTPVRPIPTSAGTRAHGRRSPEGRAATPFRISLRDTVNAPGRLEPLPAGQALALLDRPVDPSPATTAPDSSFILLARSLEQTRGPRWPSGWLLDILV